MPSWMMVQLLLLAGRRKLYRLHPRGCQKSLPFCFSNNCREEGGPTCPGAGFSASATRYAVLLTTLQRAKRLHRAVGNPKEFVKEALNIGHTKWKPMEGPDRLLLEVENDILIRPVQADIMSSMAKPPRERNHIMQLNMGEGKSSVIVPALAAELAGESRLVRVIVAKAQSRQMV